MPRSPAGRWPCHASRCRARRRFRAGRLGFHHRLHQGLSRLLGPAPACCGSTSTPRTVDEVAALWPEEPFRLKTVDEVAIAVDTILPEARGCPILVMPSSGSMIVDAETGEHGHRPRRLACPHRRRRRDTDSAHPRDDPSSLLGARESTATPSSTKTARSIPAAWPTWRWGGRRSRTT